VVGLVETVGDEVGVIVDGNFDGISDGRIDGLRVGGMDGFTEGEIVGFELGQQVGRVGVKVGFVDGEVVEGRRVGWVGCNDGLMDGKYVGNFEGLLVGEVGALLGKVDGVADGASVGLSDGTRVGKSVGAVELGLNVEGKLEGRGVGNVGTALGFSVGEIVGIAEGRTEGTLVGRFVGIDLLGLIVGDAIEGLRVREIVGNIEGDLVGILVGKFVGAKVDFTVGNDDEMLDGRNVESVDTLVLGVIVIPKKGAKELGLHDGENSDGYKLGKGVIFDDKLEGIVDDREGNTVCKLIGALDSWLKSVGTLVGDRIAELGRVEGTAEISLNEGESVGALLVYKVGAIERKSDGIKVKLGLYEGDVGIFEGINVGRVGSLLVGNIDGFDVGILVIGERVGDTELGLYEG